MLVLPVYSDRMTKHVTRIASVSVTRNLYEDDLNCSSSMFTILQLGMLHKLPLILMKAVGDF